MSARTSPGPRERLLDSARRLTYERGVGVGVDAILEDADVARGSLYQHFGGKDSLIAETLRVSADADLERYRRALETGGSDPRERLLAVFDELDRTTSTGSFRGCRYTAADLALPDPEHPAHEQTLAYKLRLRDLFLSELHALEHPQPDLAADQLLLLIDGVLVAAVTRPDSHPAAEARLLASQIIDAGRSAPRRRSRTARGRADR